jgi:hypothetical protein
VLFAVGAALSLPTGALAQTPQYPPSTSTTSTSTTTTAPGGQDVRDFGAVREGESFDKRDCGFAPGATASVTFGSQDAGTTTVGSDGCVSLRVDVRAGRTVAVNGRTFAGACGENTITVRGPEPSGSTHTAVNRFTIECPASQAGAALTRTGGDFVVPSVVGLALAAAGAALVVAARRRTSSR